MKLSRQAAGLLCAALVTGCAGAKVNYVKADFSAPDFVSVLPPANNSNDLTAPRSVGGAVASALIGMGYFPIVTPVQEGILRKMGLTDGGQVNAFKMSDLAQKLGTDGVAMITVQDFRKVNIGFYISPTVEATTAMYDAAGEKLWEAHSKFTYKKINITPTAALQAAASELAGDMVSKMFKTSLVMESQTMAGLMAQKAGMNKPSLLYPGPGYRAPVAVAAAKTK